MRISIIGRNIEVSEYLRDIAEKQVKKLDKYFNSDVDVQIVMSVQRNRHIVEVTIPCEYGVVRAEEVTGDMYASINNVLKKIERRLIKHRTRLEKYHRSAPVTIDEQPIFSDSIESGYLKDNQVVKTKQFDLKPMTVDEAIMQMELLGHSFYVFSNGDTGEINVLYQRKDGDYGLIQPR